MSWVFWLFIVLVFIRMCSKDEGESQEKNKTKFSTSIKYGGKKLHLCSFDTREELKLVCAIKNGYSVENVSLSNEGDIFCYKVEQLEKWEYDTSLCLYNVYYKTENIYYEERRGWERPEIRENYEFEQRKLQWIDAKAIYLEYIQKEKSNNNIVSQVSQKHVPNNISYQTPIIGKELKKSISDLKRTIAQLEKNINTDTISVDDSKYKISYSKDLNQSQLQAVATISGKTLVIAGAGSGKTRTLIYRTSYLLENGVQGQNILLLTFTKKAANEIKDRVNALLGNDNANKITTGTFHAFCNMVLAKYSKLLGINSKFTILDQGDSEDLIDLIKKESFISKKEDVPFPRKGTIQSIISMSRNKLMSISDVIAKNYENYLCYVDDIQNLADKYHQYKRENDLYDYDDLIEEVSIHLTKNQAFKRKIQSIYKYIMVDEYQDTNIPQKKLIDLIAEAPDISLMAVGDDNQSIYAFRGANYKNILKFGETYPNAKLIKLEQNYRSSKSILDFVNCISNHISLGYKKELFTSSRLKSSKPQFIRFYDEEDEANFIGVEIAKSYGRLKYKDFAILCRNSFHSNAVQLELTKRKIPFVVYGGIKFAERRHIKDIIAYLRVLWNPLDAISWNRILTILEGIGKVTAQKIILEIKNQNGNFEKIQKCSLIQKNEAASLLFQILFEASAAKNLISTFSIIEKYYVELLKQLEDDWKSRIEDFKVLKRLCAEHKTIETFLTNLALDPPSDTKAIYTKNEKVDDAVTVSTIHSAKGLEWNTVFVVSLIDGAIPNYHAYNDYEQMEEERKLFYVACSRAKERLFLTAPSYYSTYAAFFEDISRFVAEIDKSKYILKE